MCVCVCVKDVCALCVVRFMSGVCVCVCMCVCYVLCVCVFTFLLGEGLLNI